MNAAEKKICVIIPVFNNGRTIRSVIEESLRYCPVVLAVNDGSTDGTAAAIAATEAHVVTLERNSGKGVALRRGFEEALSLGFDYAITLDGDAQHFPSDIPRFIDAVGRYPEAFIIGVRQFGENVSGKSRFGRGLSNTMGTLFTLQRLRDAQSGYRLYPLRRTLALRTRLSRYDFEVEILVRAGWAGYRVAHIPIEVHYDDPEVRISHFRVLYDNVRQTLDFFKLGIFAPVLGPVGLVLRLCRRLRGRN